MVNSVDFGNRIKRIMDSYELTASTFAEKIGVQRSSISHILSGRNKPSLDFILKITDNFNDVDIYWLLHGKGNFPKKTGVAITQQPKKETTSPLPNLFDEKKEISPKTLAQKKIQRIVVFYDDGTFEEYKN